MCKWKKDTNLSLNQENNHADCLVPCDQALNFSKLEMLLIQYMQWKYPRTTFEATVPSEKNILSSTSFYLENTILVTSLFKVYLSKRCRWVCSRNCKFRFEVIFFLLLRISPPKDSKCRLEPKYLIQVTVSHTCERKHFNVKFFSVQQPS